MKIEEKRFLKKWIFSGAIKVPEIKNIYIKDENERYIRNPILNSNYKYVFQYGECDRCKRRIKIYRKTKTVIDYGFGGFNYCEDTNIECRYWKTT